MAQNSSLPAILGAESMQEKDAVILLRKGQEKLIFPGNDGYELKLSKGSKIMPITPSASGHMLISCDHFDQAAKEHGAKGKGYGQQTVFVIDLRNTAEYCEARDVLDELAEASGQAEAHVTVSPAAASSSSAN